MKHAYLSISTLLVLLMSPAQAQQTPTAPAAPLDCSKPATAHGGSLALQALADGDVDQFRRQLFVLHDCALAQKLHSDVATQ